MSEPQSETNVQTDSVVTQPPPDSAPAPASPVDVAPAETRQTGPEYAKEESAKDANATPFTKPDLESCPRCSTGLLYVVGWDSDALHETQQPIYAPNMLSGGGVQVACFVCGHSETFPLNPREAPANPNPGA